MPGADVPSDAEEENRPKKALQDLLGRKLKGRVRVWKDLFGFITCNQFADDIFLHEGNIDRSQASKQELYCNPWSNALVEFTMSADEKGRPQAKDVKYVPVEPSELASCGRTFFILQKQKYKIYIVT